MQTSFAEIADALWERVERWIANPAPFLSVTVAVALTVGAPVSVAALANWNDIVKVIDARRTLTARWAS